MIKKVLNRIIPKKNKSKNFDKIYFSNSSEFEEQKDLLKLKNIFNFENIDEKIFVDMPATKPKVSFPLSKVGVTNRKHKIKIKDIFNKEKNIDIEANIKIFLNLTSEQRGLHMSRIEKAMQKFQNSGLDIKQYSDNLLKYVIELQNSKTGEVEIEFYYEKLIDKNSSNRLSHEILKIYFNSEIRNNGNLIHKIGLVVPFMNACPCPQRWAIRDFYYQLKNLNFSDGEIYRLASLINFGTHTNLGEAKIFLEDLQDNLSYEDLYSVLDNSVLITRELLSGRDEFEFIKQALIKEQFCEDSAREIVKNLIDQLKNKLLPESLIEVSVEVNESIHFHNLRVEIKDTLNNILKNLKN